MYLDVNDLRNMYISLEDKKRLWFTLLEGRREK